MTLLQEDLRDGFRALTREPWTSAAIILTLALAIGANSAIFTVVNAVLLRPLPYESPDRVVMLREVDPRGRDSSVSLAAFDDSAARLDHDRRVEPVRHRRRSTSPASTSRNGCAEASSAPASSTCSASSRSSADRSPRAKMALAHAKTAVLAYRTWQQRFGAEPAIIGRSLLLNNEPHDVIGVTPPRFEFPIDDLDVWLPYSSYPVQDRERSIRNSTVIGRLLPDVSDDQASAELQQNARDWSAAYPDTNNQLVASLRAVPRRRGRLGRAQSHADLRARLAACC